MLLLKISSHIDKIKALLWYLGSTLLVAIISIAINPLLAKNLSPSDYAIIGYYNSFTLLLTPFITFYLSNYFIQKFYFIEEQERAKLKSTILYMLLYFSLGLSAISLLGIYIYHFFFNAKSEIEFLPYALLAVFSIQFSGIYSLTLAELRMKRQPIKFAIFSIVSGVILILMALVLVVFFKGGAIGRMSAILIGSMIMFVVAILFQKDGFKHGFDWSIFKDTVSFCWPLVIAACLGFACNGFDRIALERLNNLTELGYYSVGAQIAAYLSIFSTAINSTFQPDIYENYAKKKYKRVALFIGLIIGSITIVVAVFILFAPFLVDILTAGRYIYSTKYTIIIVLSTITASTYYASSQITICMGYTKLLLFVKIISSVLSILLYNYLIENWTYKGAAWGSVLSYLIFFSINILFLYSYHKLTIKITNGVSINNKH